MEPKKQAASKLIPCSICGKIVHARGLHGHMRLLHGLVYKTFTQQVLTNDSSRHVPTHVKSVVDLSKNGVDLSQGVQLKKITDPSHSAQSDNRSTISDNILTPFQREWKQGRDEKLKTISHRNYEPGYDHWIRFWKQNIELAREELEKFKAIEKRTNGLVWLVAGIKFTSLMIVLDQ